MSFVQKTWEDRNVQYPRRFTMTNNGTVSTIELARDNGTVTTEGDKFDASTMNDLETRILNAFGTTKIVSIPISGYAATTGGYYCKIAVAGMTSTYVGTQACDFVRSNPANVTQTQAEQELFNLITDIESGTDMITVYVSAVPTTAFQIRLFGV